MVIRKKKCRECDNAITHNTVCCPYCGSVDLFGYYRNEPIVCSVYWRYCWLLVLVTVWLSAVFVLLQ